MKAGVQRFNSSTVQGQTQSSKPYRPRRDIVHRMAGLTLNYLTVERLNGCLQL